MHRSAHLCIIFAMVDTGISPLAMPGRESRICNIQDYCNMFATMKEALRALVL